MGPFAAALMNRYGVRRMALSALTLIAAGLLLSLAMTQVWHLILPLASAVGTTRRERGGSAPRLLAVPRSGACASARNGTAI